jgi:glycosyltransferase involved in cell wall biosynthesis
MLLENQAYPQDVRVRSEANSLVKAGYRVRVIAPRWNGQPVRELVAGVEVERYRLPLVHSGSWTRMLIEYMVAHAQLYSRGLLALVRGTDVMHAHNPPDTLFPIALLGRTVGCQFVFDQHDLFPELVTQRYGSRLLARIARAARRMSMRTAQLVITTNEAQSSAARSVRGGTETGVIVVRNGLPREWLDRPPRNRSGALRDPKLLFLGALEPQDGVDGLPTLLSLLIKEHGLHAARLTVVGTGSRLAPLKAEMQQEGLGEHVHFTGVVPHERALAAIAEADICLDVAPCNDFNHQTTMLKIIEYLTLGKPTVSFPLIETMRLGGDAIAYPECDDVRGYARLVARLAASERLRSSLAGRARARAPSLVWDGSAKVLLEGYRRLDEARL